MLVRTLGPDDLPMVIEVQRTAYPDALIESPASFARKLERWPSGALGAFEGGELVAYLFCHPWTADEVAPLDARELVLPETPSCLYIHDLAVRAESRGRGAGDLLAAEALRIAGTISVDECALVAVLGSRTFWERHGFEARKELEYGTVSAWYMVRVRPASSRGGKGTPSGEK